MPPRRAARAGSAGGRGQAPTRTSRRLRGHQENDSPLRFLEVPTRRKRTVSATTVVATEEPLQKSPSPEPALAQESEEIKDELAEAQETIRELQEKLQEQLNEKERLINKLKRSAPVDNEDGDIDQERPAQRIRLTPTMRKSTTPEPSSPHEPQTLSSPLAMVGTSVSPAFSSPLAKVASSSRQTVSSPATNAALSVQQPILSPHTMASPSVQAIQSPTALLIDEQEDDTELSFFVYGKQSPVQPTKFESFVKQRMLEKERLRQEHEWLGKCLVDPDLPLPGGNDDEMPIERDDDQYQANEQNVNNSEVNRAPNVSNQTILSPIREESEPATPQTSRWGLSKIFAPVARLLGRTPRSEPPRRIPQNSDSGTSAPNSTPTKSHSSSYSSSHSSPFQMSSAASRASVVTQPKQVEEEPVTPTPQHGITAADFYPHSAPQVGASEPIRRRKTHAEKIRAYAVAEARRKAAAEKERQRQWDLDEIKWQREAAEIRQKNLEAQQKTGQKRKIRVDDLVSIPNPVKSGYGMDEKYFEEDSDGEVYIEQDISMLDFSAPPPAKKVRFFGPSSDERHTDQTSRSTDVYSPKKSRWRQDADNFNKVSPFKTIPDNNVDRGEFLSRPYTGKMFADPMSEETLLAIDSIFGKPKVDTAKKSVEENAKQKTASPKSSAKKRDEEERNSDFNWSGHFTVPDDSDDESELEGSSKAESPTPTQKNSNKNTTTPNVFMGLTPTGDNEQSLTPPPPPTPAHAALPTTPGGIPSTIDSDALAKARSIAEKYKPKTPSGLRATSRLSASPNALKTSLNGETGNVFGAAPFPPVTPTPVNNQSYHLPASPSQPDATITNIIDKEPQNHTYDAHANNSKPSSGTSGVPYEQSIQYAIDLANAVPIELLSPREYNWPAPTPFPWPLDPEVEAALDAAERHPDWAAYCDEKWKSTWNIYLQEKAEGKHRGALTNPLIPTPMTV